MMATLTQREPTATGGPSEPKAAIDFGDVAFGIPQCSSSPSCRYYSITNGIGFGFHRLHVDPYRAGTRARVSWMLWIRHGGLSRLLPGAAGSGPRDWL
jgi:hypothetical protein